MNSSGSNIAAGMNIVGNCLVVSMKSDLDENSMRYIQNDILNTIKSCNVKKVLLDISLISIIDLKLFSLLKETSQLILVLGADVVFVGFQAGVASALVDLDADFEDIRTAVTMDDGFAMLKADS